MNRFYTPLILLIFLCALPFAINAQGVQQLWGTTAFGGPTNTGTIYSLDLNGNKFTNRYNFQVQNNGNGTGESKLIEYNGKFYGTTTYGGTSGGGVLFEWNPVTNIYTTKVDFKYGMGELPGNLLLYNSKFYGTTRFGGGNAAGVLFEYDPATNAYTKKVEFAFLNGAFPSRSLALKDGKIYGTTLNGGGNSVGVIFEFDPATSTFTKKFDLNVNSGFIINGALSLYSNNKFYGLAQVGGTPGSAGVIFEWDPTTNIYTQKYNWTYGQAPGSSPAGGLTLVGTKFYGMTYNGGTNLAAPLFGGGVIFEYDPVGNTYTKKYDFTAATGHSPFGDLEQVAGKLYGMTSGGGANNVGTIFEYDPVAPLFTKKVDLVNATGSVPHGSFLQSNGKLYGMTAFGGADYNGTLFEYDPATNNYTKKIDLNVSNGMAPILKMATKNGNFYGITSNGGDRQFGSLYEFSPSSSQIIKRIDVATANGVTPVYGSTGTTNGSYPSAGLVEKNGKYYGMTLEAGANAKGTIFEWDAAGNVFTKKLDIPIIVQNTRPVELAFIPPVSCFVPYNNKFVGIINNSGLDQIGTIFEYDPATNNFTLLKDFTLAGGAIPYPSLEIFNGKFYGTTHRGGANNEGTIFEWDPATNTFTKKIDLNVGPDGSRPLGGLVLLNNKFYGVTYTGGLNDRGVLFEYDPAGNTYTKKKDADDSDFGIGKPFGTMAKDGTHLFGMAAEGGANDKGAVFEWRPLADSFIVNHSFNGADGLTLFENEIVGFNELAIGSAPIAKGTANACESYTFPSPINAANYHSWIPLTDANGDVIAEINPNGNSLGTLNYSFYKHDGPVRIESGVRAYIDRNIVITPQFQPITPVDVRVYVTKEEFEKVLNATDSVGAPYNWFTDFDDYNDLRVIKRNITSCADAIPPLTPPFDIPDFPYNTVEPYGDAGCVVKFSVTSFSTIYIVNFNAIPLPVDLLSFNGKTVDKDAQLVWKTANESNLKHFIVERSVNGKDFIPAGSVAAINDPADHEYQFTDKHIDALGATRLYYRLRQEDIDGKAVYSRVIVLTINAKGNIAMIYPNPVRKELGLMVSFQRSQQVQWNITDNSGRMVKQGSLFIAAGSTNTNLDISSLARGVYYLSLDGEQVKERLKFIKE